MAGTNREGLYPAQRAKAAKPSNSTYPVSLARRFFAFALAISLLSPLGAEGVKPGEVAPEARAETSNSDGDLRVIPDTLERELLPEPESQTGKRTRNAVSLAGVGVGLALSAVGISLFFSAAGDGLDSPAMHQGLTVAVSGSLVAAIFSALRNSRPNGFEAR